jgi:hypothetical protein
MVPPRWLLKKPDDGLSLLFENRRDLYQNGIVVWGAIVQANELLFDPGRTQSCPAAVVFSLDPQANPEYLSEIGGALYELKDGERNNPEEERIGDHLKNEMTREYGMTVPPSISPELRCLISTTFFQRSQLPGNCLAGRYLPLVANTNAPYLVAPVPPKFWERSFLKHWLAEIR